MISETRPLPEWKNALERMRAEGRLDYGAETTWAELEAWLDIPRLKPGSDLQSSRFVNQWLELRAAIMAAGRYIKTDSAGIRIALPEEVPDIAHKRGRQAIRRRLQDAVVCGNTETSDAELQVKLDIEQERAANQAAYMIHTMRRKRLPVGDEDPELE